MLELDSISTLAAAAAALVLGIVIRRRAPLAARLNLPATVLGGLAAAGVVLGLRRWTATPIEFDRTMIDPLMIAFFTAIGFGASMRVLRQGGPLVIGLFALSAAMAAIQALVGQGVAVALGRPPLLGVLCGTVSLAGGPATGLAFAPAFEEAGIHGAGAIALSAATLGIIAGGLLGAPLATLLIERHARRRDKNQPLAADAPQVPLPSETIDAKTLVHAASAIIAAMWLGSWIGAWITAHGVKLPAYIGGMIAAAALRNLDDATSWLKIPQRSVTALGETALTFFLVLAIMTLKLWQLSDVAAPMLAIVAIEIVVTGLLCAWPIYRLMGGDYDAAVITAGFFGFMIGTTPVAMANMDSLVRRFGPSPRAYLAVPLVGAFFIDLTNSLIIQTCIIRSS